ncbi:MAG: DAK2 domain-containing protein [Bacillota bacterium]
MSHELIDGTLLREMILSGAAVLEKNKADIDVLNVFPVPDGDTGTNMNMTMVSAVKEVNAVKSSSAQDVAKALAAGSLRGARGNSGVILSQIFRGFARGMDGHGAINARQLAQAFDDGVKSAYKAVMRPKEGTMLTVARYSAAQAMERARAGGTVYDVMNAVVDSGEYILAKTPEMLPVLKQAGVVDAGGKGLLLIYKGFRSALFGEAVDTVQEETQQRAAIGSDNADIIKRDIGEIAFGYCTEFFIQRIKKAVNDTTLNTLRAKLEKIGDSVVVAGDDMLIKVHVHTNAPDKALQHGLELGELDQVKIDNMWEQNRRLKAEGGIEEPKVYALVAVAMGEGFVEIMKDLNVDKIICCEQTMNPSIEEIYNAIEATGAENVFFFPNNKNVFLAAQQAAEQVVEKLGKKVYVVPTYSIPQGIGGVLAFHPEAGFEENVERINNAIEQVYSGYITYAVRDSVMDDKSIKKGDYLGIGNGQLLESGSDMEKVIFDLLKRLVQDPDGVITVYYGQDVPEEDARALADRIEEAYPECDVDIYNGGQPLYYYIFSVE